MRQHNQRQHQQKTMQQPPTFDANNFPHINGQRATTSIPQQNAWSRNTYNISNNLLSPRAYSQIMTEMMHQLSNCQNRQEQIQVMFDIACKYVYGGRP